MSRVLTEADALADLEGRPRPDAIEQEIQAKGLTAPRVTPDDIEANIADTYYFTAADGVHYADQRQAPVKELGLLTFCVLVLRNGTKVVGINYGPVSPENFNAAMGREESRKAAIEQVWPLMGYELRSKLAGDGCRVNPMYSGPANCSKGTVGCTKKHDGGAA